MSDASSPTPNPRPFKVSPLDDSLGVRMISASADEVVLAYDVDGRHHQPFGIVHGGVHCAVTETACSIGASLSARERGQAGAVGLENHTSFLHAVRSGTVTVTARPLTRGRRSQLWEATSRDDTGRIVSTGRVRLLCIEPDTELAGETVQRR
jgi:uncharacterized protein (TIGR00369 family)